MRQEIHENVGSYQRTLFTPQTSNTLPVNFSGDILRFIALKLIVTKLAVARGLFHVRRGHASNVRRLNSNVTMINPVKDACGGIRSANGLQGRALLRLRSLMKTAWNMSRNLQNRLGKIS